MIEKFKNLWIEKCRSATIGTIALSDDNRVIINKFYKDKEIPNLLNLKNIQNKDNQIFWRFKTRKFKF